MAIIEDIKEGKDTLPSKNLAWEQGETQDRVIMELIKYRVPLSGVL